MNKKWRSLLATGLAFSLALTGCGGKGGDEPAASGGVAAEDLTAKISVQYEEAWKPHYEAAVKRLNETFPNIEVQLMEKGAFDHLDTLDATDSSNEDVADVYAIPADRLAPLAKNDALASIDAKTMADHIGGWNDFDAGLGGNFKVDGNYLAFPFNIETLIVYVNTANAKAQNIDPAQPIDFSTLQDKDTVLIPVFDAWYGVSFANAAKLELLGKKEDGTLFTDMTSDWKDLPQEKKDVLESVYSYWKMHADANSSLFDSDAGYAYVQDQFKTGAKGVVRLGGPWEYAEMAKGVNEGELELYPIDHITVKGKPLAHWQGGWGLVVNARNEGDEAKMQACQEMIKEIVNPDYAVDLFKATGKILENVDAKAYADSDLTDVEKKIIQTTIDSYDASIARPLFEEWGKVWDSWKNALLSWNSVKPASAEDAYKELQASFAAMMSNF